MIAIPKPVANPEIFLSKTRKRILPACFIHNFNYDVHRDEHFCATCKVPPFFYSSLVASGLSHSYLFQAGYLVFWGYKPFKRRRSVAHPVFASPHKFEVISDGVKVNF